MNKDKKMAITLFIGFFTLFFLDGCHLTKNISSRTQSQKGNIEFIYSGKTIPLILFTQDGDQFMEKKILRPLGKKFEMPSEDKELAPQFFYTITSEANNQNSSSQGIIYAESGCGASREFLDFRLDHKTANLEISRDHEMYIKADEWLQIPSTVNIFQYVCSNNEPLIFPKED